MPVNFLEINHPNWRFELHFTFWKNQGLGFAWYPHLNQGGLMFFLWAIVFKIEEDPAGNAKTLPGPNEESH